MTSVILVHPEIPPNAGNIIRLAANTGCALRMVRPMGFTLEDKQLRRAGLDYHEFAEVTAHDTLSDAIAACNGGGADGAGRQFIVSADGGARYDTPRYAQNDIFIFGCESTGLPPDIRRQYSAEQTLYIPMRENSRSYNLSNAVAIIITEAWRQLAFAGAVSRR